MIYIKTKMQEMPETCVECDEFNDSIYYNKDVCGITLRLACTSGRSKYCPLVEIENVEKENSDNECTAKAMAK